MTALCVIKFATDMTACKAYMYANVALISCLETFQNTTPVEAEILKHILI